METMLEKRGARGMRVELAADVESRMAANPDYCLEVLRQGMQMGVQAVVMVGRAIYHLERHGREIPPVVRKARVVFAALRGVGAGSVLPELVNEYMGKPAMLERFMAYPLNDQARIVGEDGIEVAEWSEATESYTDRMLPVHELGELADQVLGKTGIRSLDEQRRWKETRKKKGPKIRGNGSDIITDRARKKLYIPEGEYDAATIMEALAKIM